jgi:adenylyltransferase/sulfurtransferase
VGTPWIDGAIQEISGVVRVFVPPDGSCYECTFTDQDYKALNLRYSCPGLKPEDVATGKVPTTPTVSSIIGGIQVQEAVKLLHGIESIASKALVFNGHTNFFYLTELPRRDDCLSHETFGHILDSDLTAGGTSVRTLLESIFPSAKGASLQLDRDFVSELTCRPCGTSTGVFRPRCEIGAGEELCGSCGEVMSPELITSVDRNSPLSEKTLAELGVPEYDIVRLSEGGDIRLVLLGGDSSPGGKLHDSPNGSGQPD